MRRARPVLISIGVMLTLVGLLWVGQGLGYVHWPQESFMLDMRIWMLWGGILALFGAMLIGWGRRRS